MLDEYCLKLLAFRSLVREMARLRHHVYDDVSLSLNQPSLYKSLSFSLSISEHRKDTFELVYGHTFLCREKWGSKQGVIITKMGCMREGFGLDRTYTDI